jgi:hypothetical protein
MNSLITRLRSRLTYANVTASLALFVALGGTGYAAITLPRDSVGNKQIRGGAVRSSEIRNNSIQTRDIARRAKAALRGQRGPVGPAGPAGPAAITERALVQSEGRIVAGTTDASSWSASDPGRYRIQFKRDVTNCAYSATLAAVPGGTVPEPAAGRITVAHEGGAAVIVRTFDAAGNPAQQPFHLIVAC